MATTNRPTTTTAVEADLRARADFRGIDEGGQVHYLLGMCMALLANANIEIEKLERKLTWAEAEIDRMERVREMEHR